MPVARSHGAAGEKVSSGCSMRAMAIDHGVAALNSLPFAD